MTEAHDTVVLRIPRGLRYQLIYRARCKDLPPIDPGASTPIVLLAGARDAMPRIGVLVSAFGVGGALKTLAKLCTGSRELAIVMDERGALVHYSWVTLGHCAHYPVGPHDAVIGPIWTDEGARGRGYARITMQAIGSALAIRGFHYVYIDTSNDNVACQRSIKRAGFDPPLGAKPRH